MCRPQGERIVLVATDMASARLRMRNAGGEMDEDLGLTLKIRLDKTKYAWSLYRSGIIEPIKFSVPIFSTEAAATAAGMEVLTRVSARAK
jgi:hypothetical protein